MDIAQKPLYSTDPDNKVKPATIISKVISTDPTEDRDYLRQRGYNFPQESIQTLTLSRSVMNLVATDRVIANMVTENATRKRIDATKEDFPIKEIGITEDELEDKIRITSIAEGLEQVAVGLRMNNGKEDLINMSSETQRYLLDKSIEVLSYMASNLPIYWNKSTAPYGGKQYIGVAVEKGQIGTLFSKDQLKNNFKITDGSDYGVGLADNLGGRAASDYASSISGVIRLLDELTKLKPNQDRLNAPLFGMYYTHPHQIRVLFKSLVTIYSNKEFKSTNDYLKDDISLLISRMLNPDDITEQNLAQILTGTGNNFFKRQVKDVKANSVAEANRLKKEQEDLFEDMITTVSPLIEKQNILNDDSDINRLLKDIFKANPDFIKYALNAPSIEQNGKVITRFNRTRVFVAKVGAKVTNRLMLDSEMKNIVRAKYRTKKPGQTVSIGDIRQEIVNKYGPKSNKDSLISGLLGENATFELFRDAVLPKPKELGEM